MAIHSEFTGKELHEAYHYVQETDPGAVGSHLYWLKVSTGTVKRRNDANSAWIVISPPAVSSTFTALTDVPATYSGQASKLVAVKGDESGLEFIANSNAVPAWVTNSPDNVPASPAAEDDEFTEGSLDAKWTWQSQGSATVSFPGYALFKVNTTGSVAHRYITQPTPTGNWSITAKLTASGMPSSTTGGTSGSGWTNIFACGLALRESATGKVHNIYLTYDSFLRIYTQHFTNNTFSTTPFFFDHLREQAWYWLRIEKNSTNYLFSASYDGVTFFQFGSETIASFFTTAANQIGIVMDARTGATDFWMAVNYFRRL